MRAANPETDQVARSLLQKAVRRGYPDLALQIASYLRRASPKSQTSRSRHQSDGDTKWLRNRIFVIAAEESWPSLAKIGPRGVPFGNRSHVTDFIVDEAIVAIAHSKKRKDAAGLGTLAFEFNKMAAKSREQGVVPFDSELMQLEGIRIVQLAMKRSEEKRLEAFWDWAKRNATDQLQQETLLRAETAYKRAGWPWDQAFALAAAYLAVREGVPSVSRIEPSQPSAPFPYWVAVDRHTKQGKAALRILAEEAQVGYEPIAWASFYFESAKVDELVPTLWWDREVAWRFQEIGLSVEDARSLWERWRPRYQELVAESAEELENRIVDNIRLTSISLS